MVGTNEKLANFHIAPDCAERLLHALTGADHTDCATHLGDHETSEGFAGRCLKSLFLGREHIDCLLHKLSH